MTTKVNVDRWNKHHEKRRPKTETLEQRRRRGNM